MPLYDYKCPKCGLEFEDLMLFEKKDEKECPECGTRAEVQPSVFGISSSVDSNATISTDKEIDRIIGQDADKRRKWYDENRKKRWGDKTPEVLNIPKDSDGKYTPIQHLGNDKEKITRKEYTEALKEHKKERIAKGTPQFEGSGFGKDNDSVIVKKNKPSM